MPQVNAIAAHWNALFDQKVALPLSHREAAVGMNHAVPGKAFASGRENVPDEAWRFGVDIAVGADKSHGYRADPAQDQLCARIEVVALHAVSSLPGSQSGPMEWAYSRGGAFEPASAGSPA